MIVWPKIMQVARQFSYLMVSTTNSSFGYSYTVAQVVPLSNVSLTQVILVCFPIVLSVPNRLEKFPSSFKVRIIIIIGQ